MNVPGFEKEEFCYLCGRRRPLTGLYPLTVAAVDQEEARQYACRASWSCHLRWVWQAWRMGRIFPSGD